MIINGFYLKYIVEDAENHWVECNCLYWININPWDFGTNTSSSFYRSVYVFKENITNKYVDKVSSNGNTKEQIDNVYHYMFNVLNSDYTN